MSATVSACVIARDEDERLPGCLDSLAFCDETIVVDGGSRDATVEVAREAGARVLENPWPGFGAQRNTAIDHATGDWILEIDADERVTPRLRQEIQAFLAEPPPGIDIAALPLRDLFLGAPLGPSSKYPKYRYRLFRRGAYRHDESRVVHEGLWAFGRPWAFDGDIEHLLAANLREAIGDAWIYARLEAAQAPPATSGRDVAVGAVLRPVAKFGYRLIIDGGWRDGWRGVLKIGLDCASDVVVVMRQQLGRFERVPSPSHSVSRHFGQRRVQLGSIRIVAVASGRSASAEADAWLRRAAAAGADVGLITDAPPPHDGLHVRVVDGVRPLAVLRALDAENQLRPVDALVATAGRARRIAGLMPAALRGGRGPVGLERDPADFERQLREHTRGASGRGAAKDAAVRPAE